MRRAPRDRPRGLAGLVPRQVWAVRIAVLTALGLTLWFFGPRAAEVAAARLDAGRRQSPPVALDRVGFLEAPEWLEGPLLLAVAGDLEPHLRGSAAILDEAAALELKDGLEGICWVRSLELERVFPDRFRLMLDLRRPELVVRDAQGNARLWVDRDAVALPVVEGWPAPATELPATTLRPEGGTVPDVWPPPGRLVSDPRVRAALAVVREWRRDLAPRVPGAPRLLEVDANNLDSRWIKGPHHPEIRVVLQRADGESVDFAYGRPATTSASRVPVEVKAHVLTAVLAEHPGLMGLVGGDLRFGNRWRDWLLPRAGPDPAGPWK